ncbi:MAG: O-methyltransferase [Candidatus Heimdallarchaeota archaeon]|nr:O-methyltransferase [Candidatus Heimdallarchaeota archaeon]
MSNFEELFQTLERMQNEDAQQRLDKLPREIRWRSIDRDTAEFITLFARSINARNIVEIGTSQGYSTIWLGLVAKANDGKVISFEIDEKRVIIAQSNIMDAGLDQYVEIIHGDPRENINLLPKSIDLLFLDAEKDDYLAHFIKLFDNIREGGSIVADNAISHFADLREYINHVRLHPQCNSVLIPLGRGIELTLKRPINDSSLAPWNDLIR